MRKRTASARSPDAAALERAVRDFLRAAGQDPGSKALRATPRLVAKAWAEEFLDGYGRTPRDALAEKLPAPKARGDGMVVVTGLRYRSVCPHHLLPFAGTASVAYVPGRHLVGFGRLGTLLDTLGHRLVLQEELAQQVADALVEHLGARGAACLLSAEQACLRLRGGEQHHAATWAEAWSGLFARDRKLRAAFRARAGAGP